MFQWSHGPFWPPCLTHWVTCKMPQVALGLFSSRIWDWQCQCAVLLDTCKKSSRGMSSTLHTRIAPHTAMQKHGLNKISHVSWQMFCLTDDTNLSSNIWEIVVWGLLWFSSSKEALKNTPKKESRIAEFHWVLNSKTQNHHQVSQKLFLGKKRKKTQTKYNPRKTHTTFSLNLG